MGQGSAFVFLDSYSPTISYLPSQARFDHLLAGHYTSPCKRGSMPHCDLDKVTLWEVLYLKTLWKRESQFVWSLPLCFARRARLKAPRWRKPKLPSRLGTQFFPAYPSQLPFLTRRKIVKFIYCYDNILVKLKCVISFKKYT